MDFVPVYPAHYSTKPAMMINLLGTSQGESFRYLTTGRSELISGGIQKPPFPCNISINFTFAFLNI